MNRYKYIKKVLLVLLLGGEVYAEAVAPENIGYFQISAISVGSNMVSLPRPETENFSPPEKHTPPTAEGEDQQALSDVERTYNGFMKLHSGEPLGLVIGRGNVQGIDKSRITIEELKELTWLFVDPGDAGGVGFLHDNAQDTAQGNALKTTWPIDFSIKDSFDAVVFDYGTIQYIGDDGEETRLGQERFAKEMALVITKADGTTVSKSSFDAPYKFQSWLIQNNPKEMQDLEKYYGPLIRRARERQSNVLKKGLLDAYRALKKGGVLFIPIDGTTLKINFSQLLSVPSTAVVRHSLNEHLPRNSNDSPVLPEINKGMGTSYSDYYSIVKN